MPIELRGDFDAPRLRAEARKANNTGQVRRLLALAAIYDGATRTRAAEIGGVTPQIVRDWVIKFNAHGPAGLIDRKAPGQPARLTNAHRAALALIIESGPIPAVHGAVRWRIIDLCQWIWDEFRVTIARQTLSRELRALDYRKLSARPRHHAQAAGVIEDFKKAFPPVWTCIAKPFIPRHVGMAAGQPDPHAGRRTDHRRAAVMTRRRAASPTLAPSRMQVPTAKVISTRDVSGVDTG